MYTWYAAQFWFVTDDAYISFRYARNLAQGHGLRYNLGVEPPVEGYSNLLWVLLTAPVEAVGADPGLLMPMLSIGIGGGLLVAVYRTLLDHFRVHLVVAFLATLSLATTPMFTVWATGGLATMALAFLVFVTFERFTLADRPALWGGGFAGLGLAFIRTEGIAWLAVLAILAAASRARDAYLRDRPLPVSARPSLATTLRPIWGPLAVILPLYAVYFATRTWYFEDWVSNTTRVKVVMGPESFLTGGKYVLATWLATFVPWLSLMGIPEAYRRRQDHGLVVVTLFAAFPIWSIVVGGDYLPFGRQLLPAAPFGAILLALWAQRMWSHLNASTAIGALLATIAIGLLPAYNLAQLPHEVREILHFRTNTTRVRTEVDQWAFIASSTHNWRALGEAVANHSQPGDSWVAGAIGARGYFSDLFIYDVGGLVNRSVAERPRRRSGRSPGHEKTVNRAFFLPKSPTYLRAELVRGNRRTVRAEVRAWSEPEHRADYAPIVHKVSDELWLLMLRHTDTPNPAAWRDVFGEREPEETTGLTPKGRWHKVEALTAKQQRQIRQLEALGYAAGSQPGSSQTGVQVHLIQQADSSPRLYTSGHAAMAGILTPDGTRQHVWRAPFNTVFPKLLKRRKEEGANYFRRAWLLPEGHLLALFEGIGLVRLDAQSEVIWAIENNAHHDLAFLDDGTAAVLTRHADVLPEVDTDDAILEDFVTIVDLQAGTSIRSFSLLTAVRDSNHALLFDDSQRRKGDLFHTNSIRVLDGAHVDKNAAFAAGNYLLSSRILDAIFVVDAETERVIWTLQGPFKRQHDPHFLDNGNLLLFDNVGLSKEQSRVLEMDPNSGEIVSSYTGTEQAPLFSRTCGLVQALPNGGRRIVESAGGRVLDIDVQGQVVWSWNSPHRVQNDSLVATLFQMDPVDLSGADWLQPPEEAHAP